jgi:predicted dinucleotide-binding enzyme
LVALSLASSPSSVNGVDLVIVTIPEKSIPLLPQGLFRALPEAVIVVDTGNYYPSFRDGRIATIESGMTESGWVAQQLGRPVLEGFQQHHGAQLGRRRPLGRLEGTDRVAGCRR